VELDVYSLYLIRSHSNLGYATAVRWRGRHCARVCIVWTWLCYNGDVAKSY
jgi:hypothetical protein